MRANCSIFSARLGDCDIAQAQGVIDGGAQLLVQPRPVLAALEALAGEQHVGVDLPGLLVGADRLLPLLRLLRPGAVLCSPASRWAVAAVSTSCKALFASAEPGCSEAAWRNALRAVSNWLASRALKPALIASLKRRCW